MPLVPVGAVAPAIPLTPVVTSVTPVPSSTPLPAVPAVPQFDIRQPGDDFIEQSRFNPNPTPAPFVPLNQTPGPFEGTPFGQRIPFRPKPLDHLEPAGPPVTSPSPCSAFPAFPATPAPEAPEALVVLMLPDVAPEAPVVQEAQLRRKDAQIAKLLETVATLRQEKHTLQTQNWKPHA